MESNCTPASPKPPTCSAALASAPTDVVAYVLPNALETAVTLLAGATAGIVNPINPLLEPAQISAILRETGAKVVVTLKPFPKTDLAQKVAEAVAHAPNVKTVLEVDLNRYLSPPKSWIVPFVRPKNPHPPQRQYQEFQRRMCPPTRRQADLRRPHTPTTPPPISTPAAPPACPRSPSTAPRA